MRLSNVIAPLRGWLFLLSIMWCIPVLASPVGWGEFYQVESNETLGIQFLKLLPNDTELTIYSHCLTPGTSTNKSRSEHADLFVTDEKRYFVGLWLLGAHSTFYEGGLFVPLPHH